MAKMMKLRLGVADDPTALQPSLSDCLAAMLQQADGLMDEIIKGLMAGTASTGPRRIAAFQGGSVKETLLALQSDPGPLKETFIEELTRLVYEGGGKDQPQPEALRFQDLQLFEDDQLDQSIEVARAQQEVAQAVDDSLPALDALISTMLGWRTIQPGLNPLRPDVFVRALQASLAEHVPEAQVREALITPSAGLMGVNLRKLYRELAEWLRSTGVEPAVPVGGRIQKNSGASKPVTDTVAKTLLTLDRLRKLLAGDFDQPRRADFLHTVPASLSLLNDMQKTDELVKRLEKRAKPAPNPDKPVDMLADIAIEAGPAPHKIGQQLGEEVVRMMFDHLSEDRRLLPALKRQLRAMEPAVQRLTQEDSRFFSDRNHPARQVLDRITQRSLAFSSEEDAGWARFMESVDSSARWLESKVIDADTFGELMDYLQDVWSTHDQGAKQKRVDAARALLHAEQRNLLAQKLAAEFTQGLEEMEVADFIREFLRNAWAQVVAEAQLSCEDGSSDPNGYRALVDDLIWSVQSSTGQRGRARRLVQMIPGMLKNLRQGLDGIGYPPELTLRFFDHLITLHRAAVQEGRAARSPAPGIEVAESPSQFSDSASQEIEMWLDANEAQESGFMPDEPDMEPEHVASPGAAQQEHVRAEIEAARPTPPVEIAPEDLRIGAWVEIHIKGEWVRAQLTWASPHATLFMFTSIGGTAHSMSRRTMDKLRANGQLSVVADRPVVDEALDQVAQTALKNSVEKK